MKAEGGRRGEAWAALGFLGPNLVGLLVFTVGPVGAALLLGFYRWDLFREPVWVGTANFVTVLGDPLFWKTVGNTAFLMLRIPVGVGLSLLLAMGLNRGMRGTGVVRAAFFLPSIIAGVPVYVLWQWMYAQEGGLFNQGLGMVGVGPVPWLMSAAWAKPSLMIMGLWIGVGGPNMVLYLAALQGVNPELYEAARIDGAGRWARFWAVTWPMVSPTTFFILTMEIIAGLQGGFDAAYVMTGGGPADATRTVDYYIYSNAYEYSRLGQAAAGAWVLFVMVLAATMAFWWAGARKVHYQ